jgi:hypothetical protein
MLDRNTKMVLSPQDGGTGTGAVSNAQLAKEREIYCGNTCSYLKVKFVKSRLK